MNSGFEAAKAALAETTKPLQEADASRLLREIYGLSASVTTLNSEIESTQMAACEDGAVYVLKTARTPSASASFELQSALLLQLADSCGFAVPRIIATRRGDAVFEHRLADGQVLWGYLQTLAEGESSDHLSLTSCEQTLLAKAYGHLSCAMAGIEGPAQVRPVLWHVDSFPRLTSFLRYVEDRALADDLQVAMERFAASTLPRLRALPWQVVHNDANPQNVFVSRRIGRPKFSFIDFGDACRSPRLCDLASLCAHRVTDPDDPVGALEPLIRGYASVIRFTELERLLLCELVIVRQAALLLINAWRARLHPEDRTYIEKNCERNRRGLRFLLSQDSRRMAERVHRITQ